MKKFNATLIWTLVLLALIASYSCKKSDLGQKITTSPIESSVIPLPTVTLNKAAGGYDISTNFLGLAYPKDILLTQVNTPYFIQGVAADAQPRVQLVNLISNFSGGFFRLGGCAVNDAALSFCIHLFRRKFMDAKIQLFYRQGKVPRRSISLMQKDVGVNSFQIDLRMVFQNGFLNFRP